VVIFIKKILIFVSSLALFVTLSFSSPHQVPHKKATDEEPPPVGTTITTD